MKQGRTLQQLAAELERQTATRKDYLAPQGKVEAVVVNQTDGSTPFIGFDGFNGEAIPATPYAHRQLADHLGVPRRYYDRMQVEQPGLLAENINTWLHADAANQRMIRTLDNRVRAFLSPKYRPLDNFDLANVALPKLIDLNAQIMSCELTETRMYIKAILPDLSDRLPEGLAYGGHHIFGSQDGGKVVAAIVISNSELGDGTLRVEPSVFTTFCTNLAVLKAAAMRKYHVGRAFEADANYEVFRDETREADDRAFWLKVGDVVQAAFDPDVFAAAVESIRNAAEDKIESEDLPKVVEVTVKRLSLPASSQNSILTHLARGGDVSRWGLSSAITSAANDFEDYEGAMVLERAGGEVLALPPRDWQAITSKSSLAVA